jgi:hypothetical protein
MENTRMICNYRVIYVNDFGAHPDSGQDAVVSIQRALEAAAACKVPVILKFGKGRYDLYPGKAVKLPYHITNTTSEIENPDVTKTFGMFIKAMKDLIIEGDGTLLMLHGKMTSMVIDQSENIEIRNLNIDYARPSMSEMTVLSVEEDYIDFKVNQDSWYSIEDGKLIWVGEGWSYTDGPSQEYDPERDITWRTWNPVVSASRVEELEPFLLRFYYEKKPAAFPGNVFQMRDGIRDQVGIFIVNSGNVSLRNMSIHYMHGLGIVGQYSENLYFEGLNCEPRPETGRTCASFADFMQISGCKGKVSVLNSRFVGAHDDAINVHGTHLKIVGKISPNQIIVRFMHHQTYGFHAFFPGDEVDFVNPDSLTVQCSGTVKAAEMVNLREILLTIDQCIPENIKIGDLVENMTWTPEVEIKDNHFSRIPTRGILLTTRRKVVIEENEFRNMIMSAVLIADDGKSWYESGMVRDAVIRKNRFIACGMPTICIAPENSHVKPDNQVHSNIIIENNTFILSDKALLHRFRVADGRLMYAKSTGNLSFINNDVEIIDEYIEKEELPAICLKACSSVKLSGNYFNGLKGSLQLKDMTSEQILV